MKKFFLIGMGLGDPDHMTMAAIAALKTVDVVFAFDKGDEKSELVRLRKAICDRYAANAALRFVDLPNPARKADGDCYMADVDAWHRARAALLERALLAESADIGAMLVWGDPALYDSTMRVLDLALAEGGLALDYEIIPGVSSVQVLAAKHRIPLNAIAGSVLVTTGRTIAKGLPPGVDSIVVMLDAGEGLRAVAHENVDIYWGGNLGAADEALVSGRLADVVDEIARARRRLKEAHGWVMDVYLLRRRSS
ncbi:MAG: precorrin-6A synthase (deacetylating) [Hyphomicrobium sp.]